MIDQTDLISKNITLILRSMSSKSYREPGGASLTFCPISFDGIHKSRKTNAQKFYAQKNI